MQTDKVIFWDKRVDKKRVRKILADEAHPRFVEFASLLLSRTNEPKAVFKDYLSKESFCKNWAKIKRRMRQNKWNDSRIVFWDEVYQVARKKIPKEKVAAVKERPLDIDPEIKKICQTLRKIRKRHGLTQNELAKKTGLSQQSISFAEQGYINISLKTLKRITDALDLRIELVSKGGEEK